MDLDEDGKMTENNTTRQGSGTPAGSSQTIISPLEMTDQSRFTYDLVPNGDSPRNGPVEGSSTSGGSMTPHLGSPTQSPLKSAIGTVPTFPRQRVGTRERLTSVNEDFMTSYNAEDRGFEMVPRPENPVEAHRLANNYMVTTCLHKVLHNLSYEHTERQRQASAAASAMQVYGDASLDAPNRSQTHSQVSSYTQCIGC